MEHSVREAARRRPGNAALIAAGTTVTWADLDARVDAAAARLSAAGPRPGDRVALVLGSTVEFAVTFLGILRAGLVAVPLNPGYTADELSYAIQDAGTSQVVDATGITPGPGGSGGPAGPDGLAVLLYTSGTSGRPKGAMLTHDALAANHRQLDRIEPSVVGPDDVVLLAVPFFHAYGLNTGLGTVIHHGATGVLVERFDAAATLATIERHAVTVIPGVPSMYAAWAGQPAARTALAGVRTAVCGAAPLPTADAERFTAATGKNVIIGYGLTEAAPVLTTTAVSGHAKTGSIGRPLPGVELVLRAADGTELWRDGSPSPAEDLAELDLTVAGSAGTDPGEIVVRGANLFAGYWPDGRDGPDRDGWWATGDVAFADADGDLVLVDRVDDLILVNGFNVYPAEIERVLDGHPGVREAAVVAVPDPDTGQAPYAYVVAETDPPPDPAALRAYCAGLIARYKLPVTIEIVPELPHSATGKVRKAALR